MRWDNLFDDLEGQLEHELGAEDVDLRAEEERLRLGRMSLRDRLSSVVRAQPAGSSFSVRVSLLSGEVVRLRPRTFGKDWISAELLEDPHHYSGCIVPLSAISALSLTPDQVAESLDLPADATADPPGGRLADRLGLAFALRDLCRRRCGVAVRALSGMHTGTIDRVGRDHLDLAVHELDSPRRAANVREYRILPFRDVVLVRLLA